MDLSNLFGADILQHVVDQLEVPGTFLDDLCFPNSDHKRSAKVRWDSIKGTNLLAPYIARKIGNKTTQRGSRVATVLNLPVIGPSLPITEEDVLERLEYELITTGYDLDAMRREMQMEDVEEMISQIRRRREQQAAQALFTGKIDVDGEGIDEVVDYWASGGGTTPLTDVGASGDYWSVSASASPISDLRAAALKGSSNGGLAPNVAIMGKDALASFLSTDEVRSIGNSVFSDSDMKLQIREGGVISHGFFAPSGLEIVTYGEEQGGVPVVPADMVLLTNSASRGVRVYGHVSMRVPAGREAGFDIRNKEYNVNAYNQNAPLTGVVTEVKTATIPVPANIHDYQVMKVVA